jgi:hypothetical protein
MIIIKAVTDIELPNVMAVETLAILLQIREEMAEREPWNDAAADELLRRLNDEGLKELQPNIRSRFLDLAKLYQFHQLSEEALIILHENPRRFEGFTTATVINDKARRRVFY